MVANYTSKNRGEMELGKIDQESFGRILGRVVGENAFDYVAVDCGKGALFGHDLVNAGDFIGGIGVSILAPRASAIWESFAELSFCAR